MGLRRVWDGGTEWQCYPCLALAQPQLDLGLKIAEDSGTPEVTSAQPSEPDGGSDAAAVPTAEEVKEPVRYQN